MQTVDSIALAVELARMRERESADSAWSSIAPHHPLCPDGCCVRCDKDRRVANWIVFGIVFCGIALVVGLVVWGNG